MTRLGELVEGELSASVDPRVTEMARAIAGQHGEASVAVLFYGSCLREQRLEGLMLDFYLIVSDYRLAYPKRWLAAANRLIPPNVFYFEHSGLVSKYAILSEEHFDHECSPCAWTVSTAARFAQPSRLVWARDRKARESVIGSVAKAAPTLLGWARPLSGGEPLEIWRTAFANTFAAELRAEKLGRSGSLVESSPGRYDEFGRAALELVSEARNRSPAEARRWWRRKQRKGKLYSIARLAKASFTFAGGADYIAWKINRHAGTSIRLKPWQRRFPLLAAISLLPRLLRTGAVR